MATPTIQTDVIYSDIMMDFDVHPVKKDVVRAVNEAAVKKSIRNLILTGKRERLFQPEIGSNVKQYLFELMSPHTADDIRAAIEQTIKNYEPRAKLIGVRVSPDYNNGSYAVLIAFYVTTITEPTSMNIRLEMIR